MKIVTSILPAMSADVVLEKAMGRYQSVVVIGYDQDGALDAAASLNLRGHEILWIVESFKQKLIAGEYGKDA